MHAHILTLCLQICDLMNS